MWPQGRLWVQSPALRQAVPSLRQHLVSISGAAERVKRLVLEKEGAQHTQGFNKHVWHERVRGQWGHVCACGSVCKTFHSGVWVRVSLGGACVYV